MPLFEIKNRWTGAVIFARECETLRQCVEEAVLSGSDLRGSNLRDSDLRDSNLSGSNLRDSDLSGSDLRDSDLRDSNLSGSDLRPIRDDIWAVLSSSPSEVSALRDAVASGKISGSTYEGECACLVGTLANARGCSHTSIPGLSPNSSRPAERFFMAIKVGDTPETSQFSALALEWIDEWLGRMRAAFGPTVVLWQEIDNAR